METKTFKNQISKIFIKKGFIKKGNYYSCFREGVTIVIGLQKSNFSNSYYINVGYIINLLNPCITNLKEVDGDVRDRFSFDENGKNVDLFDLEKMNEKELDIFTSIIEKNIHKYVDFVTSLENLITLLKNYPIMLLQTKLIAKQLMGFES